MITVYQGETGGYSRFEINTSIPAVSGYVKIVATDRQTYTQSGYVASGYLYVAKSGLTSRLAAANNYMVFPQVTDALGLVYFLEPTDLTVVEVP